MYLLYKELIVEIFLYYECIELICLFFPIYVLGHDISYGLIPEFWTFDLISCWVVWMTNVFADREETYLFIYLQQLEPIDA